VFRRNPTRWIGGRGEKLFYSKALYALLSIFLGRFVSDDQDGYSDDFAGIAGICPPGVFCAGQISAFGRLAWGRRFFLTLIPGYAAANAAKVWGGLAGVFSAKEGLLA